MKNHRLLAIVPTSLLLLSACDEGASLPNPGSELRNDIIKVKAQPTSKTFTAKIMPNPIDDGGGGGGPHFEPILQNADAVFGAAFEGSAEAEEFCPSACDEVGAAWEGRVSAEGAYEVGDVSEFETDEGIGFQAEIYGEVSMACDCVAG